MGVNGGEIGDEGCVASAVGVPVARAVGVKVALGEGVGLAGVVGAASVGVLLGGTGEGAKVAPGEGSEVGGRVTAGGVGRNVAVAVGSPLPSKVTVASLASPSFVGATSLCSTPTVAVAASSPGTPTLPTETSSISKYVGPPMIQPNVSSAQRAPGNVSK